MSEQNQDYLAMSDEDIMNMTDPVVPTESTETSEEEEQPDESQTNTSTTEQPTDTDPDESEDNAEGESTPPTEEEGSETEGDGETEEDTSSTDSKKIDYETEYKKLTAPFKANGRDFSVDSVDDAITLMQMGANYNKKMAALKPSLKVLKLLENNGLLDEKKLSYFIDLDKKDPGAVKQLLKESGLDYSELDNNEELVYKPQLYSVDDKELAVDEIVASIEHSPSFNKTTQIISKEWDQASKRVIAETPQLISVINDHVSRGIFDVITKEVDKARMLGRFTGVSDIEAYRQVGDAIQAQGGFNHLGNPKVPEKAKTIVPNPKPQQDQEDKLNDKRKAAGPTKGKASTTTAAMDLNPLSMSDEAFEQMVKDKFL